MASTIQLDGLTREEYQPRVSDDKIGDFFHAHGCHVSAVHLPLLADGKTCSGSAVVHLADMESFAKALKLNGTKDSGLISCTLRPHGRLPLVGALSVAQGTASAPMAPLGATHEWKDSAGCWHTFDPKIDRLVSEAMLRDRCSVNFSLDNGRSYTIDFAKMQQVNDGSRRHRQIRSVVRTCEWMDGQGKWHTFELQADTAISRALLLREASTKIWLQRGSSYTIDFTTCAQVNNKSGQRRPLRFWPRVYEWQDGRGRWHAFDTKANMSICWQLVRGKKSIEVCVNEGYWLDIDIESMSQRSLASGRCRPLRLMPFAVEEPQEVPILSDLSGAKAASAIGALVLKVDSAGDLRRFDAPWQKSSSNEEVVANIYKIVGIGFGMASSDRFVLRYSDDDGDLCTLAETTFDDCASFIRSGILKLTLQFDRPLPAATSNSLSALNASRLPGPSQVCVDEFEISTPRSLSAGLPGSNEIDILDSDWSVIGACALDSACPTQGIVRGEHDR